MLYLISSFIADVLAIATHRIVSKGHGVKAPCSVGDESQPIELILNGPLEILVARRRGRLIEVVIKVAQGGKEGALYDLCLLEVLLLEHLLEPPLDDSQQ